MGTNCRLLKAHLQNEITDLKYVNHHYSYDDAILIFHLSVCI